MAAADTAGTSFSDAVSGSYDSDAQDLPPGVGPWKLAWRRLRRNKVALFFGFIFVLLVVVCLLAPVYAHDIAHTSPNAEAGLTATVKVGGKVKPVVNSIGIPIGPTWHAKYFFGADINGRDTAVRLLYGGRNSLEIGAVATIITMVLATFFGVLAGFYRGWWDAVITRFADVIWAYPAVLLGITLGTVFATGGIGPIHGTFLLAPAIVVGIVYIPYVLKPVRAQVLQLREREFIDAARQQGLSSTQIMFRELLPNISSTIVVFMPLILANAILLEAGLSYLGAGVQPPNPSWGTMIAEGLQPLPAAFSNVLVPGFMLVIAVMSVNIFGDGVRDALDPRAKVRIAR
ncbi:MAG TPA: ABC transporter permease [Solirubrobacteraceae bacterium]|jgi:peptide/nickel transport system permease protein|nr:ABC transporter permease [Solirubrobacteraceae bacterium]